MKKGLGRELGIGYKPSPKPGSKPIPTPFPKHPLKFNYSNPNRANCENNIFIF